PITRSFTGLFGRRRGNNNHPASAESAKVPIALPRRNRATVVRTCSIPATVGSVWGTHQERGSPDDDRGGEQHAAHEQPGSANSAVAHICPRARRIANQRATFAFCCANVSANRWPPVPSATKYNAFVDAGCSTASMLALPGLA